MAGLPVRMTGPAARRIFPAPSTRWTVADHQNAGPPEDGFPTDERVIP
ncbi:hypothetical protein [Arthrobacter sp. DR-2P]|nr:hypothetical protein [Arthrobacter sp. DR-2P]